MSAQAHQFFIGLLSGTSLDSVDVVIADFSSETALIHATYSHPIPDQLRSQLLAMTETPQCDLITLGQLDAQFGSLFASAVNAALTHHEIAAEQICAIGSHGQNLCHAPDAKVPFTWQIGDPNIIAEHTGIPTVADFRRRDIAAGGFGAPLAPIFHHQFFRSNAENRIVLNIGGIANISYLPADPNAPIYGCDTGPGNALMDGWCKQHKGEPYDAKGAWASEGNVHKGLLKALLSFEYFQQPYPKATGREIFHLQWLQSYLSDSVETISSNDVQATLAALTAHSVIDFIEDNFSATETIFVCGGGVHNTYLLDMLSQLASPIKVTTTDVLGIAPDWVEGMLFAWLAKNTLNKEAISLPSVTGASHQTVLGGVYFA